MPNKGRKYEILGGIKVTSKQLREWGKSGGRPKKYANNAQRQRAYKLRKKQKKFGAKAQLRAYHQVEKNLGEISKNLVKNSLELICNNCGVESIGGPQHIGESCYRFCGGRMGVKRKFNFTYPDPT